MKQQLIFMLATFAALSSNAQNAVPATGGNATGSGGSSSFSYGQASYHYIGGDVSESEGVQQTFTIVPVVTLASKNPNPPIISALISAAPLSASVYPNPAINYIDLTIDNSTLKDLNYMLFDVNGHAVATGLIQQKQTQILMPSLISGSYVLKINQGTKQIKSFIIIKK